MKWLRPRDAGDKPTLLLASTEELTMLIEAVTERAFAYRGSDEAQVPWRKLKAELMTARKAL